VEHIALKRRKASATAAEPPRRVIYTRRRHGGLPGGRRFGKARRRPRRPRHAPRPFGKEAYGIYGRRPCLRGDQADGQRGYGGMVRELAEAEIRAYVASGEPMDKAGPTAPRVSRPVRRAHRGRVLQCRRPPLCKLGAMFGRLGLPLLKAMRTFFKKTA
jgi:hypothetical protein